jgi:hypothetical protein
MPMPSELGGYQAEYGEPAEYDAQMEYRRERCEIEASAEEARLRREAAQSFAMAENAAAWESRAAKARAALLNRCATIEPGRLRRAADLGVTPIGPRRYAVQGSVAPWIVDLDNATPCRCPDAERRTTVGPCKHLLASMLAERIPAAVEALKRLRREDEYAASAPADGPFTVGGVYYPDLHAADRARKAVAERQAREAARTASAKPARVA